jgi:hypothetical protein
MHADAVFRGGMLHWTNYLDPDAADWQRFQNAVANQHTERDDWTTLEPEFT